MVQPSGSSRGVQASSPTRKPWSCLHQLKEALTGRARTAGRDFGSLGALIDETPPGRRTATREMLIHRMSGSKWVSITTRACFLFLRVAFVLACVAVDVLWFIFAFRLYLFFLFYN